MNVLAGLEDEDFPPTAEGKVPSFHEKKGGPPVGFPPVSTISPKGTDVRGPPPASGLSSSSNSNASPKLPPTPQGLPPVFNAKKQPSMKQRHGSLGLDELDNIMKAAEKASESLGMNEGDSRKATLSKETPMTNPSPRSLDLLEIEETTPRRDLRSSSIDRLERSDSETEDLSIVSASQPKLLGTSIMDSLSRSSLDENLYSIIPDMKSNKKLVTFFEGVWSDIFEFVRYNLDEKKDVFYSHEDIHRFNAEYNREFDLCESLEIDWNDWMADRTEEEILRDEEEFYKHWNWNLQSYTNSADQDDAAKGTTSLDSKLENNTAASNATNSPRGLTQEEKDEVRRQMDCTGRRRRQHGSFSGPLAPAKSDGSIEGNGTSVRHRRRGSTGSGGSVDLYTLDGLRESFGCRESDSSLRNSS